MTITQKPQNPDARLERLLGGADLAPLRRRMRLYFERRDNGAAGDMLQLTQLSSAEHEALCLLTGRPSRTSRSIRIDVGQLDAALLNAGIADSLRAALELIDGPIVNRTSIREDMLKRWSAVIGADHWSPMLSAWLRSSAAVSLLKRLGRQDPAAAEQLLMRANAVLQRLPTGGATRSQLAAETLGNAHALDNGQPTATVSLAAWRHSENSTSPAQNAARGNEGKVDQLRPADERVRDVWARAGVLVNELARPALFLNLPVSAQGANAWTPGEPGYLSLRTLLRTPPLWRVESLTIFVCENPNLVAIAADKLGGRCAPLVCTDGMPSAAQRTLLTQLTQAGAHLQYHGDFDWPGIHIANHVMRAWGAQPWRFGTREYEAAAMNAPQTQRDLATTCVAASWDPALAPAMHHRGLSIAEEAVAASLLEDLRRK